MSLEAIGMAQDEAAAGQVFADRRGLGERRPVVEGERIHVAECCMS
jgi:hypothetical protein